VCPSCVGAHRHAALRLVVANRVAEQVQRDLQNLVAIRQQVQVGRQLCCERDLRPLRLAFHLLYRLLNHGREFEHLAHRLHRLGAGERQQIVGNAREPIRLLDNQVQEPLAGGMRHFGVVVDGLRQRADRRQRGAELVRHIRHEVAPHLLQAQQLTLVNQCNREQLVRVRLAEIPDMRLRVSLFGEAEGNLA
jgi:hypothetical protein